jgi:hypothetical protein
MPIDPCVFVIHACLDCNPQDHEKELLRSRFIAIREVEVNPENYTQFCGPLSNAGTAR